MLQKSRRLACLTIILALMAVFTCTGRASGVGVKVNATTRLYRSASTSSESVSVPKGTTLTLTASSGSWGQVSYRGVQGYIPLKYLDSKVRYAAYVNRSTYVYSKASTSSSKKAVKVNTKVYVVGKQGDFCRIQNESGSVSCYIPTAFLSTARVSEPVAEAAANTAWKSKVTKANWFHGGSNILKKGSYGYIYDIKTGTVVHIKRMGGTNHADCEPASASDTAKLKKIAGGKFSWDAHAVILNAGGKYVACSINTMPHGDQTLSSNGYNGQFCLHMAGSKTHGSEATNTNHQAAIQAAYNWAH